MSYITSVEFSTLSKNTLLVLLKRFALFMFYPLRFLPLQQWVKVSPRNGFVLGYGQVLHPLPLSARYPDCGSVRRFFTLAIDYPELGTPQRRSA